MAVVVIGTIVVRLVEFGVVVVTTTECIPDVLGAVVDVVSGNVLYVHFPDAEVVSAVEKRGRHGDIDLMPKLWSSDRSGDGSVERGKRAGRCEA